MYILYRLLTAFIAKKVTPDFFCDEFSLIYSRYDGIEEIEKTEFGIKYKPEIEALFGELNDLCALYCGSIGIDNKLHYPYPKLQEIEEKAISVLKTIEEKGMISFGNFN